MMGWHHKLGDRVSLVYRFKAHPLRGLAGEVRVRSKGPGPRNFLVVLDDGRPVVVPGGNLRGVK